MPIFGGGGGGGIGPASGCAILEGATAYVGFDTCKEPHTNYFLCDGVADEVQINAALTYVNGLGGGTVELERGVFTIADPVTFPGNDIMLKGQGIDSFIDGDGLSTGEHAIVINGRDYCTVRDLSVQTEDGGTKTCHCIYITDAHYITIDSVTIVNSDSAGVYVNEPDCDGLRVRDCLFIDSDDSGLVTAGSFGTEHARPIITGNEFLGNPSSYNLKCYRMLDADISNNFVAGTSGGIQVSNTDRFVLSNNVVKCSGASSGLYIGTADYGVIEGNMVQSPSWYGIELTGDCWWDIIDGNIITDSGREAIRISGAGDCVITNNNIEDAGRQGLNLTGGSCVVDGNFFMNCDSGDTATYDGIYVTSGSNVITNNIVINCHRHGIYVNGGTLNIIGENYVGVNDRHGIYVSGTSHIVNDNIVNDNGQDAAGTYHGIILAAATDRCTVKDNYIISPGDSQEDGIHLEDGVVNALIDGNYIYNGMGDGIELAANNDDCVLMGNYLLDNDDYGIAITGSTCNDNWVRDNYFSGNGSGALNDGGTDTRLPTLVLSFVEGSTFLSSPPFGWEIDLAAEFAIALGHLPLEVQEVQRWKIWATSLVTEADAMRLEVEGYGGASNEPYTTETVAVANKASTTTNFAINDVIYWTLTPADDADIGHLLGGDQIMIKVLHEAAGGDDCETDAVFTCVEIEYV